MIQWTSEKILELIALARSAAVLGAVVLVGLAYIKSRSLVMVLLAGVTAGVFLFTVNSTGWWQDRVEDETGTLGRDPGTTALVLVVDGPSRWPSTVAVGA